MVPMYALSSLGCSALPVRRCPACHSYATHKHGVIRREVEDFREGEIMVQRMLCSQCRYSFRTYPEGIKPGKYKSERMRQLGVLLYALGLSYRKQS